MNKIRLIRARLLRWGVAALLLFVVNVAANAYDFNMENGDGKTIYYNILSDKDSTVEVTYQMIVPGGNVGINKYAYSGNVVIPETVQYYGTYKVVGIGDDAFVCCEGLTSVSIPNTVTYIGDNAFDWCSELTQVNIPESVTTIGAGAFSGCKGLTGTLTIPNSVTSIGSYAFYECTGLTGDLTIPNSVTSIGSYAFASCSGLTSLTLGNSVTSIGRSAFCECTGLTGELVIPNSVTTIGDYAFWLCRGLTSLTLGNSVTSIGDYAFWLCRGLTSLTLGNSVTSIGSYAFDECTGLTGSLTIPESVTTIGSYAFRDCTGLTSVTIPESVTEIGERAFRNCSGLTQVNFNARACTSAGSSYSNRAFYGCDNISTVNFGDNVTIISDYLCSRLTGLTEVTIPNSVKTIGYYAFYYCTRLTSVTIPNSVTSIGTYAFCDCSGLTSVTIPNSVTSIGTYAFCDCSGLTSVTIGFRVTGIGNYAFSGTNLKEIYSKPPTPPYISALTFDGVDKNTCILYVPVDSQNKYSTADYWSEFFNIEGMTFDDVLIVQTYEATEVTTRSALLRGLVTVGDEDVLEQGFEYWTEGGDLQTATSPDLIMAVTLTGLEDGVTYMYRAYAKTESGTTYGDEMTFTTIAIYPPTVQTYEATEVTTISVLLRGVVTAGSEDVLEKGFEYWTEGGDVQTITSPDLIMAVTLTGLEDGVSYTYRAYVTTESGTIYGEEMTFTTIKAPTVQTYEVTEITENSALLKGYVTAGNEDLLGQGFEYWAAGGEIQTIAMADQMMAVTITGLNEGTTYTCRAYAKTESGTTYGENVSFTTLDYADGVSDVNAELEVEARYTTDGKKVSQPQRGINIIRYSDGTAKKVLVK